MAEPVTGPYISAMDAPNPSAIPTAASRAPVHIGAVGMTVRDLDRLTAYYRDMLGLTVQEHTGKLRHSALAACRCSS